MTINEIANRWRIRRGRPALWPSDRELTRMVRRQDDVRARRAQEEMDRLATDAETYGLPMSTSPSVVVGGFIISGQVRR